MPAESNKDCIVLVPVSHHIEPDCDASLRMLERMGYHVWRAYGFSAIDQGRNVMAQQSLDKGYKELMWIDADVGFQVSDVERLRALNLPISCGVYGLKDGSGRPAADLDGKQRISGSLYQIPAVGAGFLHTRRNVYELMVKELKLEKCVGRHTNYYPFFLPLIKDKFYMGEDFAFCHRASQCGIKIVADTSLKLKHVGKTSFRWSGIDNEQLGEETYTPLAIDLSTKDDIAAITCFFNPAKFKRNLSNYKNFKDYMQQIGCPLYTVELAFGDEPFELDGADPNLWQIRTKDVMWHKERLLNLLAKRLPSQYTKIVWTDCDLRWPEKPDWFQYTSMLLDRYKIVQPYACAEYLTLNGAVEYFKEGVVAVKNQFRDPYDYHQFHPGFVWAARREFFDKFGLYDKPILGAGDAYMAFAFLGNPEKVFDTYTDQFSMCRELVADYLKWAEPVAAYVDGSIGFVDTTIHHQWHGSRKERRYYERMGLIRDFVPARDLTVDSTGLWTWSELVKPEFKAQLKDYFDCRNEDSRVEAKSETTAIVTSCDSRYFTGLMWWWDAVRSQVNDDVSIVVFELGWSSLQKREAIKAGIRYIPFNPSCFDGPHRQSLLTGITKKELCCWTKPFLVQATPYDNVIWIDVDALPIRPLDELVALVKKQPFMFLDQYNPETTRNKDKLYELLPVYCEVDKQLTINNGVFGINVKRDHELFGWWIHASYAALRNPEIRKQFSWWDQGTMIWAMHRCGGKKNYVLDTGKKFNYPANGLKHVKDDLFRKQYVDGRCFFAELRKDHPDAHIVHWLGLKKFELWPDYWKPEQHVAELHGEVYEALTYEI